VLGSDLVCHVISLSSRRHNHYQLAVVNVGLVHGDITVKCIVRIAQLTSHELTRLLINPEVEV
jgi:hypothetical protein